MINGSRKPGSFIVSGKARNRTLRRAAGAMESIESMERVFFNQVSRKVKNFVMQLNDQIGWPFTFKQPTNSAVLHWSEIAFTPPAREGCVDFRVRNLGSSNKCVLFEYPPYLLGSRFPDATFDQSAGIPMDQRRSSRIVGEMDDPDILTKGILLRNFF